MIIGRVFNPATGEYIRNAEVRIEGTQQVAISEEGGYYRLTNSPLGEVTVVATYTGHESATARLTVSAGSPATHDFELAPIGSRRKEGDIVRQPIRIHAAQDSAARRPHAHQVPPRLSRVFAF